MLLGQLQRLGCSPKEGRVEINLVDGAGLPDTAILQFIHDHEIDLVILGNAIRSGLMETLLGNTAERLLHESHCSLLAVKPPDFQCPLKFE